MKHVLRYLPFSDAPASVAVGGEQVPIRAYQIIVWMSLTVRDELETEAGKFPVVLDTGHSHNFSIQECQLREWAGFEPTALPRLGEILVNRQEVPLVSADLWVHRNRPGLSELLPKPFLLKLPQGIALYPEGTPGAPRLPLLGLRGIVTQRLRLTIDGVKRGVSLQAFSPSPT